MPVNYITINTNKVLGADLRNIVEHLKLQQDKLKQLKDNMDNMTNGSTWTDIETQFGVSSGKGQPLYNLVAGTVAEISSGTNMQQLIDWIIPA